MGPTTSTKPAKQSYGKDLGSKEWYDWSLVAFVRTAAGIDLSVGPNLVEDKEIVILLLCLSDQPYCFKDDYEIIIFCLKVLKIGRGERVLNLMGDSI